MRAHMTSTENEVLRNGSILRRFRDAGMDCHEYRFVDITLRA
jgi:hypothetical protein